MSAPANVGRWWVVQPGWGISTCYTQRDARAIAQARATESGRPVEVVDTHSATSRTVVPSARK